MKGVKEELERLTWKAVDDLSTGYLVVVGYGSFKVWFEDSERNALNVRWTERRSDGQRSWTCPAGEDEIGFIDELVDEWWATYSVEDKLCIETS
jgi:hypothetical protein